jgi:hypothetical protein
VQYTLAHHGAATGTRHYHLVLEIEVDCEGQHSIGTKLRSALAHTATRHSLQPLEHFHSLHVVGPPAAKRVFAVGIGVDVANDVVDESDDAVQALVTGQGGGCHEAH